MCEPPNEVRSAVGRGTRGQTCPSRSRAVWMTAKIAGSKMNDVASRAPRTHRSSAATLLTAIVTMGLGCSSSGNSVEGGGKKDPQDSSEVLADLDQSDEALAYPDAAAMSDAGSYRQCPDVSGPRLSAETLCGSSTIARVDITGGCYLTAICVPSVEKPCEGVEILAGSGPSCVLTFTSVDGGSTSTTVAITPDGPPYQCRDSSGRLEKTVDSHFEPASIAVDFSEPPADSGTD